jgi:hypothetical protein
MDRSTFSICSPTAIFINTNSFYWKVEVGPRKPLTEGSRALMSLRTRTLHTTNFIHELNLIYQ